MSSRDNEYEKRYEGSHGQFENDGELEEGPIRCIYIIFFFLFKLIQLILILYNSC